MPDYLFSIDVAGAEDSEHLAVLAGGFLDDLKQAGLVIKHAKMTSHVDFGAASTVDLMPKEAEEVPAPEVEDAAVEAEAKPAE